MMPFRSGRPADASSLTVDIIVNNYNYGQFVGDAIESALAQTHAKARVIVVDDGSTDDSREILFDYEGKLSLVLKEHGGQASALNAGFACSDGDAIIFLDADDVLRPEAAALVASAFAADPRVAKVQYRMEVIDKSGRPTGVVKPPRHVPLPEGDVRRAELVFPFDLTWLPTSANAFRAEILGRIFPIPERDFVVCADWYLVHLTPLLGLVVSLDNIAACYRVHGANRYEPHDATLDLEHVRQTVGYSAFMIRALDRLACELDLERPHDRILSVSDLANRLVSLKLERKLHPVRTDRAWRLALDGMRAAGRRFDVTWPMKSLYASWFVLMAAAPASLARPLAELLMFPERRESVNQILRRFHKWNRATLLEQPRATANDERVQPS